MVSIEDNGTFSETLPKAGKNVMSCLVCLIFSSCDLSIWRRNMNAKVDCNFEYTQRNEEDQPLCTNKQTNNPQIHKRPYHDHHHDNGL